MVWIRISKILTDAGVGLRGQPAAQLLPHLPGGGLAALVKAGREVEDLLVETRHAELAGALGAETGDHVEQKLSVLVALHHPGGRSGGSWSRERWSG